ncbi:hypothetical protein BDW66DRAFT_128294 [Aspergillus desertorum]
MPLHKLLLVHEEVLNRGGLDTWTRLGSDDAVGSHSLNAICGKSPYPANVLIK